MKVLLVVYSYHHNNTGKIADVLAKALEAQIKTPRQTTLQELQKNELTGFGSGIDSGKHYKELLDFADTLPRVTDRKAFIFSTCGMHIEEYAAKNHLALRDKLASRGYTVIGEFSCAGFNTNSFLKLFGGMNKGRPNAEDLKDAEEFARTLKRNLKSTEPWRDTRNYPLERRPAAGNKNPALSSI